MEFERLIYVYKNRCLKVEKTLAFRIPINFGIWRVFNFIEFKRFQTSQILEFERFYNYWRIDQSHVRDYLPKCSWKNPGIRMSSQWEVGLGNPLGVGFLFINVPCVRIFVWPLHCTCICAFSSILNLRVWSHMYGHVMPSCVIESL